MNRVFALYHVTLFIAYDTNLSQAYTCIKTILYTIILRVLFHTKYMFGEQACGHSIDQLDDHHPSQNLHLLGDKNCCWNKILLWIGGGRWGKTLSNSICYLNFASAPILHSFLPSWQLIPKLMVDTKAGRQVQVAFVGLNENYSSNASCNLVNMLYIMEAN